MEKLDAKVAYPEFDSMTIAEHLAGMVRFATIANHDESLVDKTQFDGLHKYLEETYPLTHAKLEKQIIGKRTLFYRWAGNGKSGKKPLLFMAHQDVVPVTPGTEGDWLHDPYGGEIVDGFVWGRGSCDCKSTLCLTLEAVEAL
ncbi:MAG: M20/M25/M40 family metallo-hydrolase, partial [Clostridiales bacterium]|nr:M20/M25/M40 family metallo-hydrolase [Clostridiales bacterium]